MGRLASWVGGLISALIILTPWQAWRDFHFSARGRLELPEWTTIPTKTVRGISSNFHRAWFPQEQTRIFCPRYLGCRDI